MIQIELPQTCLGGQIVLEHLKFSAQPGEFVGICGPNGAGKTTLLRGLAGLLPGGTSDSRRTAYVEQGASCAWGLTVAQVAELGRIPHGDRDPAAIARALTKCGIAPLAHRRIDQISGGQARRAMLARALATEPENLLLDEPVADLDPAAAHDIMRMLADFAAAGGVVVAVLHAIDLAQLYCTRLLVLHQGRVLVDDTAQTALPHAATAFGLRWGFANQPTLLPPEGIGPDGKN